MKRRDRGGQGAREEARAASDGVSQGVGKAYSSWKCGRISPTVAAKELKLKRPKFYLMIKRWEEKLQMDGVV